MISDIKTAFYNSLQTLQTFCQNEKNFDYIKKISDEIVTIFRANKKILIAGNGGSAADAMHFAEEFTGKFRNERPPLPVIAIPDQTALTCIGNDYGFNHIFSRTVEAFGNEGDLFIGISTSGNSQNIINAITSAKQKGMITFALLGKDGGKIKSMCDYEIVIPGITSDRIQELHMIILHIIIEEVERQLFPQNYDK